MYLKYIQIRNYKNLRNVRFEFSKGANTVIGENDSGKSNAMTALRILLDDDFYYNAKRLKESDFSEELDDWRGHWIIISAFFDEICEEDRANEVCAEIVPERENEQFLRSYIRCQGNDFGVVTLYIRPAKKIRKALHDATSREDFEKIRNSISLLDYEFFYTARSQTDFTDYETYERIVGNLSAGECQDPDEDDSEVLGVKTDITRIWSHVSLEFVDALRDASSELRKPKNPLRRIFEIVRSDVEAMTVQEIMNQIHELNSTLAAIPEIQGIGGKLNEKLGDIVGLIYSPTVGIVSHMQEEIGSLARHLSLAPADEKDIDQLGLGHLNILYIALKLVEFEYYRNHEVLNIMVIEEPEAHVHTHIQRTLFDNLNVSGDYTQVIMTTHSTHLAEVSNIRQMNILKRQGKHSVVMNPIKGLDEYGKGVLNIGDVSFEKCLERYLDAKRSVLLFSKGVMLVEGDGEEILIPALVKNGLGVTLDELGIGLINIGSVSFEYIASLFAENRLQRFCSVVTDLDAVVAGANKASDKAEALGKSRKEKLDALYKDNRYVMAFYAPHTLEVDFYDEEKNRKYAKNIIESHYMKSESQASYWNAFNASESERYDAVMKLVSSVKKGWHATLVAESMDNSVVIPDYIIHAIVFAAQEVITLPVLRKIAIYIFDSYENLSPSMDAIRNAESINDLIERIHMALKAKPDENLGRFISAWEGIELNA